VGCSRLRVAMVVSRVGMVVILMGVGVMGLCGACFDFSDRSFFPVTLLSS
jgi:low affinity Fe/Cu permease